MRKVIPIALILLAAYFATIEYGADTAYYRSPVESDAILAGAFEDRAESLQVEGSGRVVRILPDDNDGSRHQRFILALDTGQTLMVAHNIDLAPRLDSLDEGDLVQFFGEYEWNERGGVIHWTHHDPRGHHVGGWLKHDGKTYR